MGPFHSHGGGGAWTVCYCNHSTLDSSLQQEKVAICTHAYKQSTAVSTTVADGGSYCMQYALWALNADIAPCHVVVLEKKSIATVWGDIGRE
jgi:hypothetical protein